MMKKAAPTQLMKIAALPCYALWCCCVLGHIELHADRYDQEQAKEHKEIYNVTVTPWYMVPPPPTAVRGGCTRRTVGR